MFFNEYSAETIALWMNIKMNKLFKISKIATAKTKFSYHNQFLLNLRDKTKKHLFSIIYFVGFNWPNY